MPSCSSSLHCPHLRERRRIIYVNVRPGTSISPLSNFLASCYAVLLVHDDYSEDLKQTPILAYFCTFTDLLCIRFDPMKPRKRLSEWHSLYIAPILTCRLSRIQYFVHYVRLNLTLVMTDCSVCTPIKEGNGECLDYINEKYARY